MNAAGPSPRAWRPPSSGVIRGCWQLSPGHGTGWSRELAAAALDRAAEAARPGRLVLDCADIYGDAERLLGDWMASRQTKRDETVVHTKFVPDLKSLPSMSREHVREIVFRSRERLRVDLLEMVQFHWWDFSVSGWIETAGWLAELLEEGVIRHLGATNFGQRRLAELLDAGIPMASNQVQLSLLDRRPLRGLAQFCQERGVALLCYGTLAGGLLTDRSAEPSNEADAPKRPASDTRSLAKYRLIAEEAGGATALQRTRAALSEAAERHGAAMADVAVAYVLGQPAVGAAVVGLSRRGLTVAGRKLRLQPQEVERLEEAAPDAVPGPVYGLERDRRSPHGRIMRYDQNAGSAPDA